MPARFSQPVEVSYAPSMAPSGTKFAISSSSPVRVSASATVRTIDATTIDGMHLDMWWRITVCYQKTDGNWRITHEHNSVPFDMTNGKASLELEP